MAHSRRPGPRNTRLVLGAILGVAALLAAGVPGVAAAPVGLGAADSFGVLAGSGITNTGVTVVTGDVGSCPTPAVTGFGVGAGTATGTTYAAGPVTCQAKADLTTAYNDTVALPPTTTYGGPTDLGGLTLTAGVYNSPTSLGVTIQPLTLDAEGDPDAVFVFQAGSTAITGVNSAVLLINGAQACNVVWQVGSSATLGVGSTFVGSVLAATSITVNTGATVEGRLLALGGAVTLDTNTVTRPSCSAPPGSLTLSQAPTAGTALAEGTAVAMPVTTVTDTRTGTTRSWTVTATVSDLVAGGPSIPSTAVTLAQSGTFTTGSGTVVAGGLVSATGDSIGSVYTYTPTARLAPQGPLFAGSYAGTVTQTVV